MIIIQSSIYKKKQYLNIYTYIIIGQGEDLFFLNANAIDYY